MRFEGNWYESPKDEVRGYYLEAPYDKIFIGCDPCDGMTKESADSFDVYVNVSDSECETFKPSRPGQHMHWYPVNEMGLWNLSYLFWLKKVLDHHYAAGHRIYLHCHAGAYRSPSAVLLWLQSRGLTPEEALKAVNEKRDGLYRCWKRQGNVPKLKDKLFQAMREHPTWSLSGVLEATGKYTDREICSGDYRVHRLKRKYLWFYYRPRDWYRDRKHDLKMWLKGYSIHWEGCSGYWYRRRYFWDRLLDAEPAKPVDASIGTWYVWNQACRTWDRKVTGVQGPT